jgi:hypothetical protein
MKFVFIKIASDLAPRRRLFSRPRAASSRVPAQFFSTRPSQHSFGAPAQHLPAPQHNVTQNFVFDFCHFTSFA